MLRAKIRKYRECLVVDFVKKVVLGESRFIVCMGLRVSIRFRTKKVQPPQPFPPHLPRADKIKPKHVPTYYEKGAEIISKLRLSASAGRQAYRQAYRQYLILFGGYHGPLGPCLAYFSNCISPPRACSCASGSRLIRRKLFAFRRQVS